MSQADIDEQIDRKGFRGSDRVAVKTTDFQITAADVGRVFLCAAALAVTIKSGLPIGFNFQVALTGNQITITSTNEDENFSQGGGFAASPLILSVGHRFMDSFVKVNATDWVSAGYGANWSEP